jgi:hypothetical protein
MLYSTIIPEFPAEIGSGVSIDAVNNLKNNEICDCIGILDPIEMKLFPSGCIMEKDVI